MSGSGLSSTWSRSTTSLWSHTPPSFLNDEHCGGLHAALVSPGRLTGIERCHQAHREMAGGFLDGVDHLGDDLLTGQDVAWAVQNFSPLCPAHGVALSPVQAAYSPLASITANCRPAFGHGVLRSPGSGSRSQMV